MKKKVSILFFVLLYCCLHSSCLALTTELVKKRGHLLCGVSTGIPGFSNVDGKGNWSGLDVDVCKAVSAAVLGDATKVKYIPLLPNERATALLSGDVDVLARNMAWNLTRDSSLNMNFVTVTFHDLQGFLAAKHINVKSILELQEFSVCLQSGTTYGESLAEFLQESEITYKMVVSDTPDQLVKDFQEGRCEIITGGRAQLQGIRSKMERPADTVFLPEIVTNVLLGPAVRHGDDNWLDIVRWSVFAMIYAEELEITSDNIDSLSNSPNGSIQRFLGAKGIGGKGMGIDDKWAYAVIKQVGNYQESYSRNLGEKSPLKLKRGLNNLWNKGGILCSPPIQ